MTTNQQTAIAEVMRKFNFEHMHAVMKRLGWVWCDHEAVPTVQQLKTTAEQLLRDVFSQGVDNSVSTGGFRAEWHTYGLRLSFVITDSFSSFGKPE